MRLCFGAQASIADASRMLGVPQRPLYRRIEAILRQLRAGLESAGIGAAAVEEMISAGVSESLDFGIAEGKTGAARLTSVEEHDIDLSD